MLFFNTSGPMNIFELNPNKICVLDLLKNSLSTCSKLQMKARAYTAQLASTPVKIIQKSCLNPPKISEK